MLPHEGRTSRSSLASKLQECGFSQHLPPRMAVPSDDVDLCYPGISGLDRTSLDWRSPKGDVASLFPSIDCWSRPLDEKRVESASGLEHLPERCQ